MQVAQVSILMIYAKCPYYVVLHMQVSLLLYSALYEKLPMTVLGALHLKCPYSLVLYVQLSLYVAGRYAGRAGE